MKLEIELSKTYAIILMHLLFTAITEAPTSGQRFVSKDVYEQLKKQVLG